jgi:GNAT superfamily N-acetyltransferase
MESSTMKSSYSVKLSGSNGLAVLDHCDYYSRGRIITRVNVPLAHRGRGHGSTLLREICGDADLERVALYLEIAESDGLNQFQLRDWYRRHGFRDWGGVMRRIPRMYLG